MGDVVKLSHENASPSASARHTETSREPALLTETAFQRMVALERKRSERAAKPCLLMLLDPGDAPFSQRKRQVLEKIVAALPAFTRETDVVGWHRRDSMLGVIFTDINAEGIDHILKMMLTRLKQVLRAGLGHEETNRINISFELFPERRGQVDIGYDTKMGPDFEVSLGEERRGTRSAS
jgi:hypothetical protein